MAKPVPVKLRPSVSRGIPRLASRWLWPPAGGVVVGDARTGASCATGVGGLADATACPCAREALNTSECANSDQAPLDAAKHDPGHEPGRTNGASDSSPLCPGGPARSQQDGRRLGAVAQQVLEAVARRAQKTVNGGAAPDARPKTTAKPATAGLQLQSQAVRQAVSARARLSGKGQPDHGKPPAAPQPLESANRGSRLAVRVRSPPGSKNHVVIKFAQAGDRTWPAGCRFSLGP